MTVSPQQHGPLHIVYVDPWVSASPAIGPDRRGGLVAGIAAAGHKLTVLAARGAPDAAPPARTFKRLPTLTRKFGTPTDTRPRRGYGFSLLMGLLGLRDVDVAVLAYPPRKGAVAAAIYSALEGVPLALDAREVPPDSASQGFLSRLADKLRLAALRWKTAHVFAASPDIKAWFEARGFSPAFISVAPDGCDTSLMGQSTDAALDVLQKYPHLLRGPLALYAGSLNRGRPLAALLEVA
ncbi:MAG: hypothetical protein JNK21_14880, partial [Rhodospirillaceae bacterium]|nr:hypothetical protein [Rhodospirillaceae bacterium]